MALGVLALAVSTVVTRFSVKRVTLYALVLATLFTFLQGWAPTYGLELLFRAAFVSVIVAGRPMFTMLVQQWFRPREVVAAQTINLGLLAFSQVTALAAVPVLLAAVGGWRNALYALSGYLAVLTVLWWVLGRDRRPPAFVAGMAAQARSPLRAVVRYRELWILGVANWGCPFGWAAFLTFWPTFLIEERGLTLSQAGLLTGLIPLGQLAGSIGGSIVYSRWLGLKKPMMWGAGIFCSVIYTGMLFVPAVPLIAGLAFMAGFVCFSYAAVFSSYVYDLPGIRPREVAVGQAFAQTITTTGAISGPLLVGVMVDVTGSLMTALCLTCVAHLTLLLTTLIPETGWRVRPRPTPVPAAS
jgi:ACS family glucarate transporter-like MFS transporter